MCPSTHTCRHKAHETETPLLCSRPRLKFGSIMSTCTHSHSSLSCQSLTKPAYIKCLVNTAASRSPPTSPTETKPPCFAILLRTPQTPRQPVHPQPKPHDVQSVHPSDPTPGFTTVAVCTDGCNCCVRCLHSCCHCSSACCNTRQLHTRHTTCLQRCCLWPVECIQPLPEGAQHLIHLWQHHRAAAVADAGGCTATASALAPLLPLLPLPLLHANHTTCSHRCGLWPVECIQPLPEGTQHLIHLRHRLNLWQHYSATAAIAAAGGCTGGGPPPHCCRGWVRRAMLPVAQTTPTACR
jgi:hypothetical protein